MKINVKLYFKVDKKYTLTQIRSLINKNVPNIKHLFSLEKSENSLGGDLVFSLQYLDFDSSFIGKMRNILNFFRTFFILDDECRHQIVFQIPNKDLSKFNFNLFCLRIDEKMIFSIFKNKYNLISCKKFYKNNVFLDITKNPDISNLLTSNFLFSDELKSVYPEKRDFNNITFNYFYGANIYKKLEDFLDILKSINITFLECFSHPYYTYLDVDNLKGILNLYSFNTFNNLSIFQNYFKNIKLYYNTIKNEELIKANWNFYFHFLIGFFNLNFINRKKSFKINYDSERNIFEIIELDFKGGFFNSLSLLDCNISNSLIINSEIDDCKLDSVNLENNIVSGNNISKSNIKDCYLEFNTVENSTIKMCSKVNENKFEKCKLSDVFLDENSKLVDCEIIK